ncbi:MAG: branched-chain amino acid ABC transporter permease [Deltaproteobacteria bacterium]|nr:branched-chain amino acid ABC transporter permease [Deltaproteobacteria bacterium]
MNRRRLIRMLGIMAFVVFLFFVPVLFDNVYWVSILIITAINALLATSLRTISIVGHFSLGHVGFMLLGAYSSALLVLKLGISFWAAFMMAGLLSALVAVVLGYPFLKVKGIYFAILTLLTAESFRLTAWNWRSLTGGSLGLMNIPSPSPISIPAVGIVTFDSESSFYYLTIFIVLLSLLALYRLEHSHFNFNWRAIRETDVLAQSVGMNVLWLKILNFAIACFFAGIAGALFAHYQRGLSADASSRFGVLTSIYLLVYMVVGGENRFAGPIIGALLITIASELSRSLAQYQPMMIGAIAIITVFLFPEGIIGLPGRLIHWYRYKKNGMSA